MFDFYRLKLLDVQGQDDFYLIIKVFLIILNDIYIYIYIIQIKDTMYVVKKQFLNG